VGSIVNPTRQNVPFSTQTDVTGSRALNTVYQNTTTHPMLLELIIALNNADSAYVYVGAANPPLDIVARCYDNADIPYFPVSVVVPPGYYYRVVNAASIVAWWELTS